MSAQPSGFIGFKHIFLLFALVLALECSTQHPHPYNVLLITIDTLRADHLSCYRYDRRTSPAIDALAKEGVQFNYAMAQRAETWPSVTSILTSMYPHTHGVRINGDKLDASKKTIAEMLQKQRYKTSAFLTNMQSARHPGFDTLYLAGRKITFLRPELDTLATSKALKWLRKNNSNTFFLWLHYLAPHSPYIPPPPYRMKFSGRPKVEQAKLEKFAKRQLSLRQNVIDAAIGLYDGEVSYIDEQVKQILNELDHLKLKERTLVVLTADHGEELNDRNQYFGHACSIYDAALHIPLILRLPNVLPSGRKIDTVVESIDIAPTIFELLSIRKPPSFEGKSLVSLIHSERSPNPEFVAYSEIVDKVASIRTQNWRYISNPTRYSYPLPGEPTDRSGIYYSMAQREIYFLPANQDESANSIERHRKIADELQDKLSSWRSKDKGYQRHTLDKETLEELKALGYVQ